MVLVVLAVTAGCAPAEDSSTATTTSSTARSGFTTPVVGECRGLISREIIRAASDPRRPVSCDEPHGSETVFVGELPQSVAEGSRATAEKLTDASTELRGVLGDCDEDYQRYVGVSRIGPDSVRETNLARAFFIPPFDDWANGARWIRCDVVTEPSTGQVTRGTTERLRGILDRGPPAPVWRTCYRDVVPPPKLTFDFFTSCDTPHAGEALLRYRVSDPRVDALAGDQRALEEYARSGFNVQCTDRVAAHMGLTPAALAARTDVTVGLVALQVARWSEEPETRWVQCLAFTSRPTIGTLEGLGDKPLPRP